MNIKTIAIVCVSAFCMTGCIRLVHEITPQFDSGGTVNISIRTDSDDPRVNVTVDDVALSLEEIQALIEQKKKSMKKEKSLKKEKSKK